MISHERKAIDFMDKVMEDMVSEEHAYRKLKVLINFEELLRPLSSLYSNIGTEGEPIEYGFKCLLIQYWEDMSDRQLERYVRENVTMRWFCGYKLTDATPDHSYFGKLRKRIGLERLSELFNTIVQGLEKKGYVGNIFHFADASSLLSKVNLWEARDRAISDRENKEIGEDGKKKMNNKNVSEYSSDADARFGCKGNKNFWFGYKRHVRVDMRQGLITKAITTSADIPDHRAFIDYKLYPETGMVFMYKGYDTDEVSMELARAGCANAAIRKNNRKDKNKYLDRWRSSVRMPYENVFRYQSKRTRYRRRLAVEFQVLMEAIAYNFKRLIKIQAEPIPVLAT